MANMMAGLKEKVAGAPLYVWGGGLVLIVLVIAYRKRAKSAATATTTAVPLTDTSTNATGKPTQFYDASGNPITTNGTGYGPPGGAVGPTGPAGAPGTTGPRGPAGTSYTPPKPPVKAKPTSGKPGTAADQQAAMLFQNSVHLRAGAQQDLLMNQTALAHERAANKRDPGTYSAMQLTAQNHQIQESQQDYNLYNTDVAHRQAALPHNVQPVATVRHPYDSRAHASTSLQTK